MLIQRLVGFDINKDNGTFKIQIGSAVLVSKCYAKLLCGKEEIVQSGHKIQATKQHQIIDLHGEGKQTIVRYSSNEYKIALFLDISIYKSPPYLALRIGVQNRSQLPFQALELSPLATIQLDFGNGPLDGWVNGFHSWGFTGFIPHTYRQPRMALGPLTWPQGHNPTTDYPNKPGKYVGEEVGALIDPDRDALIAGFIGVTQQFGQIYADGRPNHKSLRMVNTLDKVPVKPGEIIWGELAVLYCIDLPNPDPLGEYAKAVTRLTPGRVPHEPPKPGWSSWYQFFRRVNIEDMERNQNALNERQGTLPIKLIQLDSGYQPYHGDWLKHNDRFPEGVARWAKDVRYAGFEPGIWLSPFTVNPKSTIFRTHPEAILRNSKGRPVHGGFVPMLWLRGLDPTHPVTKDYLSQTIETIVHKWGIRYLKLDFLYCGALPGTRYDPSRTRAQALRDGLKFIREVAGEETTIVGCGCPFGPAIGLVDIMRVSPDVAPSWYPKVFGIGKPFRNDFSLPATRNSLALTMNRIWTHRRWWWLDADNLLVREQQEMTASEVQSLVTIEGMIGSHYVLSDEIDNLSNKRLNWAASLLPISPGKVDTSTIFEEMPPSRIVRQVVRAFGKITVLTIINWNDQPTRLCVDLDEIGVSSKASHIIYDFWNQDITIHNGKVLQTGLISAHGVAHFTLSVNNSEIGYVGSDLHICPGNEISGWRTTNNKLHLTISLDRKYSGIIWIKAPLMPLEATCNGKLSSLISIEHLNVYGIQVTGEKKAEIEVTWANLNTGHK